MAQLFVSNTTASCTGFLFTAVGSPAEIQDVRKAVEEFNENDAWRKRGCDGNAAVHDNEDAVVAFWNQHTDDSAGDSLEEVEETLREDGDAIRCAARDLADYLRSHHRQLENLLPAAI